MATMRKNEYLLHPPVNRQPKPPWIRVRPPSGETYQRTSEIISNNKIYTICEEANCPNRSECWQHGIASIMLLGDICTRGCTFCSVKSGRPLPLDPNEPEQIADAVDHLHLSHVVLTAMTRDDLADGGSAQCARTIALIKERAPDCTIEIHVSDFRGNLDLLHPI